MSGFKSKFHRHRFGKKTDKFHKLPSVTSTPTSFKCISVLQIVNIYFQLVKFRFKNKKYSISAIFTVFFKNLHLCFDLTTSHPIILEISVFSSPLCNMSRMSLGSDKQPFVVPYVTWERQTTVRWHSKDRSLLFY